ncbi:MAG TPA: ATP-binding protein [Polyangiales bacterium]|nr:ATP-binding protein [Polyangiales bacterium]
MAEPEHDVRVERAADAKESGVVPALSRREAEHAQLAAEAQLRSQKLEALGTLAGGIAHDFNNALQAITGNNVLARRTLPPDHPAQAFLSEVEIASARASDLVRRILTFSRPSEQRRDVLELPKVIGEALKLVRATLPAQIVIHAELREDVPGILADATQIHQLVVNLATNASHAIGAAGGRIDVWLGTTHFDAKTDAALDGLGSGDYAVLHFSDDGCGMADNTIERIFDPFYTTKPVGQGTGLGLSVVHGIMKGLGGAVIVRSEIGMGSTFSLYFPTTRAKSIPPPPAREAPRAPGVERVLFVDDEEVLVVLGTHILDVLGYQSTGTSRPLEALKIFADAPEDFDVVITDLSMPGLSGFQLAQQLLELRGDVPVVMMSGYLGPEEMATARRLGVRELLLKPVGMDDLARALHRVLGPARARLQT